MTERFGLPPEQYLDYVALKGDTSDNIPGVPGVGEKTASKLVQDFGSVEALLAGTDQLKGRREDRDRGGRRGPHPQQASSPGWSRDLDLPTSGPRTA